MGAAKQSNFTDETLAYTGDPPDQCQICQHKLALMFVDGRTINGSWAYMCVTCHNTYGRGLGTGFGQLFRCNTDGVFMKIWG